MENELRVQRLTELADMLNRHDELFKVHFDITQWGSERVISSVQAPALCGSAACALGSAAMHKPFIDQGLRLYYADAFIQSGKDRIVPKNTRVLKSIVYPKYEDEISFSAGELFFGITYGEALDIFDGDTYDEDETVTASMVAERVQTLITKYK